jgi:hypothetical protein
MAPIREVPEGALRIYSISRVDPWECPGGQLLVQSTIVRVVSPSVWAFEFFILVWTNYNGTRRIDKDFQTISR